jgi:hypothetical protein
MDCANEPIKGVILHNLNKQSKQKSVIDLNFERKEIVALYSNGQATFHLTGYEIVI